MQNVGADLPLVSRSTDLAVLTGAIEAATRGRGEAVLLTGEAGVGKTRLLAEARHEAERRGVMVLRAGLSSPVELIGPWLMRLLARRRHLQTRRI
jgi:MoxR-like ATPase